MSLALTPIIKMKQEFDKMSLSDNSWGWDEMVYAQFFLVLKGDEFLRYCHYEDIEFPNYIENIPS